MTYSQPPRPRQRHGAAVKYARGFSIFNDFPSSLLVLATTRCTPPPPPAPDLSTGDALYSRFIYFSTFRFDLITTRQQQRRQRTNEQTNKPTPPARNTTWRRRFPSTSASARVTIQRLRRALTVTLENRCPGQ